MEMIDRQSFDWFLLTDAFPYRRYIVCNVWILNEESFNGFPTLRINVLIKVIQFTPNKTDFLLFLLKLLFPPSLGYSPNEMSRRQFIYQSSRKQTPNLQFWSLLFLNNPIPSDQITSWSNSKIGSTSPSSSRLIDSDYRSLGGVYSIALEAVFRISIIQSDKATHTAIFSTLSASYQSGPFGESAIDQLDRLHTGDV